MGVDTSVHKSNVRSPVILRELMSVASSLGAEAIFDLKMGKLISAHEILAGSIYFNLRNISGCKTAFCAER